MSLFFIHILQAEIDQHYVALFGSHSQATSSPGGPTSLSSPGPPLLPNVKSPLYTSPPQTPPARSPMNISMLHSSTRQQASTEAPVSSQTRDKVVASEHAAVEAERALNEAEAALKKLLVRHASADMTQEEKLQAKMEVEFAGDIVAAHRGLAFAKRRAASQAALGAISSLLV